MISLGKKHTVEDIQRIVDLLMLAQSRINYSYIPQLPIELAIVQFCEKIN